MALFGFREWVKKKRDDRRKKQEERYKELWAKWNAPNESGTNQNLEDFLDKADGSAL